jgi:hypothetical protein
MSIGFFGELKKGRISGPRNLLRRGSEVNSNQA